MNITELALLKALSDPTEFSRLVPDSIALRSIATAFPQHAEIFNKPTVVEALEAIAQRKARIEAEQKHQSKIEIKKNVSVLYQIFKLLPPDLIVYIAAFTGKYHNATDATSIAYRQIKRCDVTAATTSLAKMINRHGLLEGLNANQKKSPEQQRKFDEQYGLTIYSGNKK